MVYVPWEVAEDYMLEKWREAAKDNPGLPRPTKTDINIQWFTWLDWVPSNNLELDRFREKFPVNDRHLIQCRIVGEFKAQKTKNTSRYIPIADPLGEPKR